MKNIMSDTIVYPPTLLVAVYAPNNPTDDPQGYYDEFVQLALSNGVEFKEVMYIKLRTIDPGYFLTEGKLEEVAQRVKELGIKEVLISEPLLTQQERNLNEFLRCRVFDRTQLILEIFYKGARSAESKLQVELAMIRNKKARLSGRGVHMSQQTGRIGARGPGETAKERETQHIERRISKIRRDLKELEAARQTQRKLRHAKDVFQVSLLGYTNAGKSTILNALTNGDVLAKDQLFATLDTTTRELFINKKKIGVMTDTVGFIQQLPHHLIEAFKSTLRELAYADLLLHVVDAADPNWYSHVRIVNQVLVDLEVDAPMLYVFNKVDKLADVEAFKKLTHECTPAVFVSAKVPGGLDDLSTYIAEVAQRPSRSAK